MSQVSYKSQSYDKKSQIMSHDKLHNKYGKVVHRPCNSCISSVKNLMGTLSSFPYQLRLICKGDWGTRLQENPQLILWFVIMIQLTSRRILRD